jgi:hypothetical protein
MLPDTTDRVRLHSPRAANDAIDREINRNVHFYAEHPSHIDRRLEELDAEWDIERALEANAASIALTGAVLAATVDRRFIALPGIVAAFLLQHALQGWCPRLVATVKHFGRTADGSLRAGVLQALAVAD